MNGIFIIYFLPFLLTAQALQYERMDGGVLISEADQKVLFYQAQTNSLDGRYSRAHYIHPLYGLDGTILTEDFPEDHRHHRGVFWAWHQVLVQGNKIGDSWECRNFNWSVKSVDVQENRDYMELIAKVHWTSPEYTDNTGALIPFLEDQSSIKIFPQVENYRIMDFEILLLPLVEGLQIGGSEDDKGYGGFSIRLGTPPDIEFSSEEGTVNPIETPVYAASWMDISGSFAAEGKPGGVLIMAVKSEFQARYPWILRKQGSMQNAVFPGREPVSLDHNRPLQLRYRLLIYSGRMSVKKIQELLPE